MTDLPKIYGFNKCSEAGKDIFVPCIFLAKCNLKCPYCMNSKLVNGSLNASFDIKQIKEHVIQSKSEMVLISGGEPTCTPFNSLVMLLEEIKSWGCKIGMCTNGTNGQILRDIIYYLSYVALDIKSDKNEDYGIKEVMVQIIFSKVALIMTKMKQKDSFDYEVRTTLYPKFINEESLMGIGKIILPDERWVLQQFRVTPNMLDKNNDVKPYDEEMLNKLLKIAKEFTSKAELRYV